VIKYSSDLEKISTDVRNILVNEDLPGYSRWSSAEVMYIAGESLVTSSGSMKEYISSDSKAAIILQQICKSGGADVVTRNLEPVAATVNAAGGFMGSWYKVRIVDLTELKMIAMQFGDQYGPRSNFTVTAHSGLREFELYFQWGSTGKAKASRANLERFL
jgi:hypothetical protein